MALGPEPTPTISDLKEGKKRTKEDQANYFYTIYYEIIENKFQLSKMKLTKEKDELYNNEGCVVCCQLVLIIYNIYRKSE